MYRRCISCSADLGANEALEAFPVGAKLAFDAARGRLWALCPRCARWNLAPLEERWEAVEAAERLFTDARLRVQRENVGMAKLRDGTRLIRVGAALPGELASWRYGDQLLRRRRRFRIAVGAAAAAGLAAVGGAVAAGVGVFAAVHVLRVYEPALRWWDRRSDRRVVHRLAAPDGSTLLLRRWHARAAVLRAGADGFELAVPDPASATPLPGVREDRRHDDTVVLDLSGNLVRRAAQAAGPAREPAVLSGAEARAFLRRGMVHVNFRGAAPREVEAAVDRLVRGGGPGAFLARVGGEGRSLAPRADMPGRHLLPDTALAVEMALHEEDERRAMQGELALLEAAWREAEEIAAIADRLAVGALSAATES